MNRLEIIQSVYGEDIEWSASALSNLMFVIEKAQKVVEDRIEKALLDPENQPTQWGTVTLTMYEALENSLMQSGLQIEAWQGRYYAKEGELDQLKADLRSLWHNRGEDINVTVAKLLVKHGLGDA